MIDLKKKNYILVWIIIGALFSLTSCNNMNTIGKTKKNNYYYTNIIAKNIKMESEYKCAIVDTNFYKGKELTNKDSPIIDNFIKCLNTKYFISKPKDLPDKPLYKMFLTFKEDKFVINVYNKKYVSIHPWDGYYEMDFIDMTNIPSSYNLFNLCNYLIPR